MQRFEFNTRTRSEGESVASYVAALRELAQHCAYKDSLHDMLRDRLVCGVRHQGITNRLLAEKGLTYDKALELAQAIESAERDTKDLQSSAAGNAQVPVHHTTPHRGRKHKSHKPSSGSKVACYRCGGDHLATHCKFKDTVCHACKKRGHLVRVCTAKGGQRRKPYAKNNYVITSEDQEQDSNTDQASGVSASDSEEDESVYHMFKVQTGATRNCCEPIFKKLCINGVQVGMELDTGAAVSVITQHTYKKVAQQGHIQPLQQSDLKLKSYSGQAIPVFGQVPVKVNYGQSECELLVHVVDGEGPDLLGREWMKELKVTLRPEEIHSIETERSLNGVLRKHSEVFSEGLGCLQGSPQVKLNVDKEATPKFFKARPVPLALKKKVEEELNRLESMGIISPVDSSKWAAPVVPVVKQNGNVRLCGDFKVTINQASPVDKYPLPRVDELLGNLSGGKYFSKLDMSQAYLQLPLDEESREYVTVNTHKGLYRFNRLPFGVASAPSIFQRTMETLLQGIEGVSVYIDDILIAGPTVKKHLEILDQVLERLNKAGLRLNKTKCFFLRSQIEYLGHIIDNDGLHPTSEKVRAIQNARTPTNVGELKAFFGILNYYHRFLPNLSSKLAPLYQLLKKDVKWTWSREHETAFKQAKQALQHNSLLVHYDESKPLILACDASKYGLGAVLSHVMEDGQEKPVAYASRTLTAAEKNYSQIEKEGLAILFGVKKFHYYLYGRHFAIESDHQPLSYLFNECRGISQIASSRIQRWALTLSAYTYTIRHKSGSTLSNADALSRLPRPETTSDDRLPGNLIHLIEHLAGTTVSASNIETWTSRDPILSKVRKFVKTGWPISTTDDLKPYVSRQHELSTLNGCVLWGSRVIVPNQGRSLVLEELHESHLGVCKMKALARSYVWWPHMDRDIENLVKQCTICQETRPSPPSAPLHPWQWPDQPWSRIHLDFAGPFMGHMFLIIVDSHSKWIDAHIMSTTTSKKTIEVLRSVFANHGLPQTIVTDNGSSFTSEEFKEFARRNGIKLINSAPYHPSSNGQAERAVQTVKRGIERIKGENVQEKLSKFLFDYRITPHAVTGVPPCELLMKRTLRSRFDLLFPNVKGKVQEKQMKQKELHDNSKQLRTFQTDDLVFIENFANKKPKWIPGVIVQQSGPLSYVIRVECGSTVRRHVDNIRKRESREMNSEVSLEMPGPSLESTVAPPNTPQSDDQETENSQEPTFTAQPPPRRSTRARRAPDRFSK